jgi:molybdate transport system substrate-binding protein
MSEAEQAWAGDWQVGVRVWVERQGQEVLGEGRLELLEWIDRCHSISEAARQLGISYRHAWVTVQAVNEAAGMLLVTAAVGGRRGGGARLTPQGQHAVALFRRLRDQLHQAAATLLPALLPAPVGERLHVAAAVSLEEVLGLLVNDFALRQPGVQVRMVLGASDELAEQLQAGAYLDLFLTADAGQLQRLATAGVVQPDSIVPLAENTLACIAPADSDLAARRPADLLVPASVRVALASPSAPLGGYTRAYLESLGLYEDLLQRAVLVDHSRAVVAAVQGGQAEAGLVYSSATASAAGCRVLFRVRRLPAPIRFAGAVVRRARQPQRAREFLAFLTSAEAGRRFRRCGFLPLADPS